MLAPFKALFFSEGVFSFLDRFVTSQHALQENIAQYEPQVLPPQPFDQQGLPQGKQIKSEISLMSLTYCILSNCGIVTNIVKIYL